MPILQPQSLLAIVFGILFTLRKLDVSHRMPGHHPDVPGTDFESWKRLAMAAYGLGVWSCFLKIVADCAGGYFVPRLVHTQATMYAIGVPIDVAWIVMLVVTWRKIRKAHTVAERFGIERRPSQVPDRALEGDEAE